MMRRWRQNASSSSCVPRGACRSFGAGDAGADERAGQVPAHGFEFGQFGHATCFWCWDLHVKRPRALGMGLRAGVLRCLRLGRQDFLKASIMADAYLVKGQRLLREGYGRPAASMPSLTWRLSFQ